MVWLYVVLRFQPFELVLRLPGFVSSVVYPGLGVAVILLTPNDRVRRVPIALALVALSGWLALSLLWTEDPFFTQFLVRSELLPLIVLSLIVGTLSARRAVATLIGIVLILLAWSLVSSLAMSASRSAVLDDGEAQVGFRGTFGHKNQFGIFAVYGLCVLLPFVRSKARWAVIGVCLFAIVSTRSATVAGGLLGVLFVWVWMAAIESQRSPRERQFLLVVSMASAIAGLMIVLGLLPTLLGLYDKDLTFSGRTTIWSESLVTVSEQPLQGYGFGGVWLDQSDPLTADLRHRIGFQAAHAHNGAIEVLLEVGVVGLVLVVLLLAQVTTLSAGLLRHGHTARYGQWGLLTMLALVLMSLAEPLFAGPHLGLIVIVWIVLTRVRNDERTASARPVVARSGDRLSRGTSER